MGRCYWVQTPNRWYPIETHPLTPLPRFLPMKLQRPLARRWTLWDWIERPSPDRRERHLDLTKPLIVAKTA